MLEIGNSSGDEQLRRSVLWLGPSNVYMARVNRNVPSYKVVPTSIADALALQMTSAPSWAVPRHPPPNHNTQGGC